MTRRSLVLENAIKRSLTPEQQELVVKNRGLVNAYIRRILKKKYRLETQFLEIDDMYSAGYVGLIKAAILFDATRGLKFSTYAWRGIQSEIRKAVVTAQAVKIPHSSFSWQTKKRRKIIYTKQCSQYAVDLTFFLKNHPDTHHVENRLDCQKFLSVLPARYRRIVIEVFGRGGSYKNVAETEGVSYQRIEQIVSESINKIRKDFNIVVEKKGKRNGQKHFNADDSGNSEKS